MTTPPQTRREAQKLMPEIRAQYRELVMTNNFEGFDKLLALYGEHIPEDEKEELRDDFRRYAARALSWRWKIPK